MSPPHRYAILGTAGHIDHGKTALVKLLTGADTDRLKEEKARGISIDLGFAHLELPGGASCGVVDVPGHERFVKNMLAGACGMDAVMLVIAADEGVMPQTREHLDVLDLLNVRNGVVALTKIDMVETEWLELVTESVHDYLAGRGYGHFPIVPVSSRTGAGREALLAALGEALASVEDRPAARAFRLPVDRVFSVAGFGTVVTGTLWRGRVRAGDRVVIQPGGHEAKVRNVEVHGVTAAEARAGQRTALALSGLERAAAPRGTWVTAPGSLTPSPMLDVRLRVLPDAARSIENRQRVRFHLGASEILARVVLLDAEELAPGQQALAQIRLESEAVADRGDRFVLRTYSPARAVAGGVVLVPQAPKRKRGDRSSIAALEREETGTAADRVEAALESTRGILAPAAAATAAGGSAAEAEAALAELTSAGRALALPGGGYVGAETLARLQEEAVDLLSEHQFAHPMRWGMHRGELKSRLGSLATELFDLVVTTLVERREVSVRFDHVRVGAEHALSGADAKLVEQVRARLTASGLGPPSPKELQGELGEGVLEALEYLTFQGVAEKVTPELFVDGETLKSLETWIRRTLSNRPSLVVADLREAWGMSRKYSVPILEFFDKKGLTRRDGDVRVAGRALDQPEAG